MRIKNFRLEDKPQIFITGATGFVGSYIARQLYHEGYENITAIKRAQSSLKLLGDLAPKINWIEAGLEDVDIFEDIISENHVMVHAAAIVDFKKKSKLKLFQSNVECTADLINLALRRKVKKFIHISSISAMGRSGENEQITEKTEWIDSPLNSDYGKSKYLGEMEVWRGHSEGLPVVILNPSLVMGAGFWDRSTPEIFTQVIKGRKYYPTGSNGMVDVREVARAVSISIQSGISGERFLLNAGNISYKDLFTIIAKELKVKNLPSKPLSNFLLKAMISVARVAEFLSINANFSVQQLKVLNAPSHYNATKSTELLGLKYRPMEETLIDTARNFKESLDNNLDFGILDL